MATQHTHSTAVPDPAAVTVEPAAGIRERLHARRSARHQARLIGARNRRSLVRMLRLIAKDSIDPNPLRRHNDVLLRQRAAAVRTEPLEIAAILGFAHDPDPSCITALHQLLRDGISPLYNPAVNASELHTTLGYIRTGLSGADERRFSA